MSEKITVNQDETRSIPSGWDALESGLVVPDETPSQWIDSSDGVPVRLTSRRGDFRSYKQRISDINNEYESKLAEQILPLSNEELRKVLDSIDDSTDWKSPDDALYRNRAKGRILEFLKNGTYMGKVQKEPSLSDFLQNRLNFICDQDSITYKEQIFQSSFSDGDWVEVMGVGYHGSEHMSMVFAYAIMHELSEDPQSARVYSLGEEPLSLDGIKPRDGDEYASRVRGSRAFVRKVKDDNGVHYEARLSANGEDLEN